MPDLTKFELLNALTNQDRPEFGYFLVNGNFQNSQLLQVDEK